MELIGKIIQVLEERSGISARTGSEWRMGSFVLETTNDRFPRKMVFEVFGADKLQQFRTLIENESELVENLKRIYDEEMRTAAHA